MLAEIQALVLATVLIAYPANGFSGSLFTNACEGETVRDLVRTNFVGPSAYQGQFDAKAIGLDRRRVQMATEDGHLITYFLEQPPENLDVSTLPTAAREVAVVRVRIAGRPLYLAKRDQSGISPSDGPLNDLFLADLKILEVRSGEAAVGASVKVMFGKPNSSYSQTYRPLTPSQLSRDYFVVTYVDVDDRRRLAGFPIAELQYRAWADEIRGFGLWPGNQQ